MTRNSQVRRQLRHVRLRKKVAGTASVPRFCVSLTANNMYCQFIDDDAGVTLASSSTLSPEFKALNLKRNVEAAAALGKLAAEKAIAAGVSKVVFVAADSSITAESKLLPTPPARPASNSKRYQHYEF